MSVVQSCYSPPGKFSHVSARTTPWLFVICMNNGPASRPGRAWGGRQGVATLLAWRLQQSSAPLHPYPLCVDAQGAYLDYGTSEGPYIYHRCLMPRPQQQRAQGSPFIPFPTQPPQPALPHSPPATTHGHMCSSRLSARGHIAAGKGGTTRTH